MTSLPQVMMNYDERNNGRGRKQTAGDRQSLTCEVSAGHF